MVSILADRGHQCYQVEAKVCPHFARKGPSLPPKTNIFQCKGVRQRGLTASFLLGSIARHMVSTLVTMDTSATR